MTIMKLYKFILGVTAFAMAGCVSEDISKSEATGLLSLNVETQQPIKTRADNYEVTNFPVAIYGADGTTLVKEYTRVSDMPSVIRLSVGDYVLKSHTPGDMERVMTSPYYKGTEPVTIFESSNNNDKTDATITCKQANASVQVNFSQDFLDLFVGGWTITFNDGTTNTLVFKKQKDDADAGKENVFAGIAPSQVYWDLGVGVEKINVNFIGVTAEGSVVASKTLTKSQATQTYNGDTMEFGGGDAIVVNFNPETSTSGFVDISITANIVFTETSETVTVNVVDNKMNEDEGGNTDPGVNPDDPNNPEDPTNDPSKIVLNLPNDMDINFNTDPSLGDAIIKAEEGFTSIVVRIEASEQNMIESLEAMATPSEENENPVDFLTGVNIVGNKNVDSLLKGLTNDEVGAPSVGDKEYTFPIGSFFSMLSLMGGTNTFYMTVTDQAGNHKSGKLTLTVKL